MTNLENQVFLGDEGKNFVGTTVQEVFGQGGDDTISGALNATEPGSTLFGNTGNDYIRSRGIGDRVFGGRGNDTVSNDNGKALIYGDLGSDYLIAKDSSTTLFGGIFEVPGIREASPADGENFLLSLGGNNILKGGGGSDTLLGEVGGDTMAGGDGDDTIESGPNGASFLFGNKGKDYLRSRADDNPDTLFGGQGNDQIIVEGEADAPLLFGGVGNDTLKVNNASVDDAILVADVNPDGTFGGSDGDEGDNYLFVEGGKGHQLFGNAGDDTLALGASVTASVSMYGGRGDDYLFGGSDGGYEDLKVFGGRGDDTIMFEGSGASNSVFWGDNEFITKDFGDNVISVNGSGNTLRGGNDNASGSNSGQNKITAVFEGSGDGNNYLWGGPGGDYLDAGSAGANTTLQGGEGDDTYVFGPDQTIVPDTLGLNTYFGINADQDDAVTVTNRDDIGGAANFFITGDQSNVQTLGTGGIITTDSDKTQVLTVDNASGITKTGGGNDDLTFGNVSGSVDAGAGDDEIEVSGSVSGLIDGGAGNDTINVNGSDGVVEGGKVLGGEGDDYLFAEVVQKGGLLDGGEGADTIAVDELFGVVKGGGLGKNVFGIKTAFGGAQAFAGAGDERISFETLGSSPDGEAVSLIGGAGANNLGVRYIESETTFDGTNTANLFIQGGDGDDILQGSPYGGDTLEGGAGVDFLYGGSAAGDTTAFEAGGSDLAATAISLGDGDSLVGGPGADKFIFMSAKETGKIDLGTDAFEFAGGDADPYVINVGTDGAINTGATPENGTGYISGAFNVDTITNFNVSEGDRIILNEAAFGDFSDFGSDVTVKTFNSSAGFLFGRFGSNNQIPGTTEFKAGGTNVVADDGIFTSSFVVGGSGKADFSVISGSVGGVFDPVGAILFDESTGGLYLSGGSNAAAGSVNAFLVGVLDNPTGIANAKFGDIFTVAGVNLQGSADIALF